MIVGGHAVNLWSMYFLANGVAGLARYLPFTSKDLDLVGTMDLLDRLHLRLKGKLTRSEPRSPVLGRLVIPSASGNELTIEVLHTVKGLDFKELGRTIDLQTGGVFGRVLIPQLVLKAKIENAVTIDQSGRNDVKHVDKGVLYSSTSGNLMDQLAKMQKAICQGDFCKTQPKDQKYRLPPCAAFLRQTDKFQSKVSSRSASRAV